MTVATVADTLLRSNNNLYTIFLRYIIFAQFVSFAVAFYFQLLFLLYSLAINICMHFSFFNFIAFAFALF